MSTENLPEEPAGKMEPDTQQEADKDHADILIDRARRPGKPQGWHPSASNPKEKKPYHEPDCNQADFMFDRHRLFRHLFLRKSFAFGQSVQCGTRLYPTTGERPLWVLRTSITLIGILRPFGVMNQSIFAPHPLQTPSLSKT